MAASDEPRRTTKGFDRRGFLRSSGGYATGIAAAVGLPAAVGLSSAGAAQPDAPGQTIEHPATPAPSEPVMAYIHDAERGEVTVMAGTRQTTVHDPALVKRLLQSADTKER